MTRIDSEKDALYNKTFREDLNYIINYMYYEPVSNVMETLHTQQGIEKSLRVIDPTTGNTLFDDKSFFDKYGDYVKYIISHKGSDVSYGEHGILFLLDLTYEYNIPESMSLIPDSLAKLYKDGIIDEATYHEYLYYDTILFGFENLVETYQDDGNLDWYRRL